MTSSGDRAEAEGRRQVALILTALLPGLDAAAAEGDQEAADKAARARRWLAEDELPPLPKLCPHCGWMPIPDDVAGCWPCIRDE